MSSEFLNALRTILQNVNVASVHSRRKHYAPKSINERQNGLMQNCMIRAPLLTALISFYIFSLKCHQPKLNRAGGVNVFATFADSVQKVHGVEFGRMFTSVI